MSYQGQLFPSPIGNKTGHRAIKYTRPYTEPNSVTFIACNLRRSTLQQSWGLWISLVDSNSLIVGSVQHKTFEALIQWSWITQSIPERSIIWNSGLGIDFWQTYFSTLPLNQSTPRELLPGDKILSINGFAISSFRGFDEITAYLRQCSRLFLVAARSTTAALHGLTGGLDRLSMAEDAHRIFQQIALEANYPRHVPNTTSIRPVFGTPFFFPSSPPPSHLVKTVTPLKGEVFRRHNFFSNATQSDNRASVSSFEQRPTCGQVMSSPSRKAFVPSSKPKAKVSTNHLPNIVHKNPMFVRVKTEDDGNHINGEHEPYVDNNFFDPYEGSRNKEFLTEISSSNFYSWLGNRKRKWRSQWKIISKETLSDPTVDFPAVWTNPMFAAEKKEGPASGEKRLYEDSFEFDPDDGRRSGLFLVPISPSNWSEWLTNRKRRWRSNWKVYIVQAPSDEDDEQCWERTACSVRVDFWADRYATFDHWLNASVAKWKNGYSWNSRKRKKIQQVCEEVVHFPSSHDPVVAKTELRKWLRIRKNQWKVLRRKRQRRSEGAELACAVLEGCATTSESRVKNSTKAGAVSFLNSPAVPQMHINHGMASGEQLCIDALLEEEEQKIKSRKEREPVDISFLFYPSLGCPDDVAAHILEYLHHTEHPKLLGISKSTAEGLKSRSLMWQQLCPSRWSLPRRPRKPWSELYLSKLRMEDMMSRKQWDDLLSKIYDILVRGDQLSVIKKLILDAEKSFSFDVNYISGVVCERNSILNLAVINQRHKVVHWLVTEKDADIETSDRGCFTPLLNAAWSGDKHLVRFFMQRGADRRKIGTGHFTEALAPSDFEGLDAEGWARKKGHHDIAELIRIGL